MKLPLPQSSTKHQAARCAAQAPSPVAASTSDVQFAPMYRPLQPGKIYMQAIIPNHNVRRHLAITHSRLYSLLRVRGRLSSSVLDFGARRSAVSCDCLEGLTDCRLPAGFQKLDWK